MSDTMLLGVLRMPFGLAMSTTTAQIQYHQRGVQAADEIENLTRERDEARAEVERLTRERDKERSKETDYGEGFEEGWAAAQKQAAAELGRLRKEAWIGAALMLSGLAMILGSGLILARSYLP